MIWGMRDNQRVRATPKEKATCDLCNGKLLAKCGEIKIWHWAHISNKECDEWYEPESEWHINWKNEFPKEQQEVKIKKIIKTSFHPKAWLIDYRNEEKIHRADICLSSGKVIELQSSSLSSKKIEEREQFYDNMVWLLESEKLASGLNLRRKQDIITFRWKHPPKSWWKAKKPIYVNLNRNSWYMDLGKYIFKIKKIYQHIPCGGWGVLLTKEEFLKEVQNGGEKTNLLQ